jgi:hypothetical protein
MTDSPGECDEGCDSQFTQSDLTLALAFVVFAILFFAASVVITATPDDSVSSETMPATTTNVE